MSVKLEPRENCEHYCQCKVIEVICDSCGKKVKGGSDLAGGSGEFIRIQIEVDSKLRDTCMSVKHACSKKCYEDVLTTMLKEDADEEELLQSFADRDSCARAAVTIKGDLNTLAKYAGGR